MGAGKKFLIIWLSLIVLSSLLRAEVYVSWGISIFLLVFIFAGSKFPAWMQCRRKQIIVLGAILAIASLIVSIVYKHT